MLELLRERRSIRKFTSEPVAPEDIRKLLGAALLAPAGMGKNPLEFIVIRDRETITHLQFLKAHGTAPLASAPLAIVVIADTRKTDTWVEDASVAAILIQLEAVRLGLGSTWIQIRLREGGDGSSEDAFRKKLGIPDGYGVLNVIAVGHGAEEKSPHTDADMDFSKVHYERF